MKYAVVVSALLMSGLLADRSDACDMISVRVGLPREGATLGVGLVIGYGTATVPIATIENAPSLRVRIDTVVSGNVASGEAEIVPLFYGPDCRSIPTARQILETSYPTGVTIAFSATGGSRSDIPPTRSIVVELNQGGFVVTVPSDVARTRNGDLDFERFDTSRSWQFGEFEFMKAVIALRRARQSEKFDRLTNLAHYQGVRGPRGRELLEELISDSGLTRSQREAVLVASGESARAR